MEEDEFLSSLDLEAIWLYPSKDIKNIDFKIIDGEPYTQFSLKNFGEFTVYGFGYHIAVDASLAIMGALELNIALEEIRRNILNYKGIKEEI